MSDDHSPPQGDVRSGDDQTGPLADLGDEWRASPAPHSPPGPASSGSSGSPSPYASGHARADTGAAAADVPQFAGGDQLRMTGRITTEGIARNVKFRTNLADFPVLMFRLERYDGQGNRLAPVGVELHGHSSGQVGDGEQVWLTGRFKNGTVRAREIRNLTTGASVMGLPTGLKRARNLAIVVVALAIVAVVVGIVVANTGSSSGNGNSGVPNNGVSGPPKPGARVTVPSLAGQQAFAATGMILSVNLRPATVFEHSATVRNGVVIRTVPNAGTSVAQYSTVTMYVSSGPNK